MQTDKSIPYPRPDYTDPDLITKEMVNGTFGLAVLDDVKHFRPVMDRYNVTEEKLIERSLVSGNINPDAFDISETDPTYYGVNEMAWLPAKIKDIVPEPEEVYFPARYYVHVEWQGVNYKELPGIPSRDTQKYSLRHPHYDLDNPGLFGFITYKDSDGNVTGYDAAFFSLRTETLSIMAAAPSGFDPAGWQYIGYVKGYFVLNDHGANYLSFGLDGTVRSAALGSRFVTLGDEGCFAVGSKVFDGRLQQVEDVGVDMTMLEIGLASGMRRYKFGTKIKNKYFYNAAGGGSTKIWRGRDGKWHAEHTDADVWTYDVRIRYDYATDNWMNEPLKTLKYNMIAHGIFVTNHFPPGGRDTQFKASDMHGDFCASGGKVYHTFDFLKWEEVTGDGATHLYGCYERFWIKGRPDGIVGMMPYSLELKDVNDLQGGRKTVLQFSGFVFRG